MHSGQNTQSGYSAAVECVYDTIRVYVSFGAAGIMKIDVVYRWDGRCGASCAAPMSKWKKQSASVKICSLFVTHRHVTAIN